ncbi:MAG: low specificity L-threonine aldolase [Coriobacteriales bacterium]|nr:low specificity L-threonine aldolase [Actinomycetes bacterium]
MKMFASDNASGAHPEVMAALAAANTGHAHAYGYDEWTERAVAVLKEHLGKQAQAYFVFNGTGANVSALSALLRPYNAVVCSDVAHIGTDECGAPERFTGSKLIDLPTRDGKITAEQVQDALAGMGEEHHSQPKVVSITQATEYGTVYRPEEVRAIASTAHDNGLYVHMDGARLGNAAAFLGCTLREIVTDVGVDVLSLGGTKNGLVFGEAVVFLDPGLASEFLYVRKNAGQLASKMRFISAQFEALYGTGLWLRNAAHANRMARMLSDGLAEAPGVTITQPTEANEVFAILGEELAGPLRAVADFYPWNERTGEVRLVTSWDTTEDDVTEFVEAARSLARA